MKKLFLIFIGLILFSGIVFGATDSFPQVQRVTADFNWDASRTCTELVPFIAPPPPEPFEMSPYTSEVAQNLDPICRQGLIGDNEVIGPGSSRFYFCSYSNWNSGACQYAPGFFPEGSICGHPSCPSG